MRAYTVPPVRTERRPISHWVAFKGTQCLGANNSIALLRHQLKGIDNVIFKAVR